MVLCPVPYVLAALWLVRKGRSLSKTSRGRAILGAIISGLVTGLYSLQKLRQRYRSLPPLLPVGLDRRRYGLSELGFVPDPVDVLKQLPSRYRCWEDTAARLAELNRSHKIHDTVDRWAHVELEELLPADGDSFSPAIRRAYAILSMIAQCYIWSEGDKPRRTLPISLAAPLQATASRLGLPPVATHAAVDLWNFKRKPGHSNELCQEAFECLTTMTGTVDEEWFYLSSTACQALAGPSVLAAYDLHAEAIPSRDILATEDFLDLCADALQSMCTALGRLQEKCTPNVFWHGLRPLLQGSGGSSSLLQDGVVFEGGDKTSQHFAGASAAQSTAIPVFDAVLGVAHNSSLAAFLKDMRKYMPRPHREYLELMQLQRPLRETLLQWRKQKLPGVEHLIPKFNLCIDRLVAFRKVHWRLVGSHIVHMDNVDLTCGEGCLVGISGATNTNIGATGSDPEDLLGSAIMATLATKIAVS